MTLVSDEDIGRAELARGGGDDGAGPQDRERPAVLGVRMAARLVPHLEPAVRVVMRQELDERVEDLVHVAGRYRPHLAPRTPTGGSALPLAGENAPRASGSAAGRRGRGLLDDLTTHGRVVDLDVG